MQFSASLYLLSLPHCTIYIYVLCKLNDDDDDEDEQLHLRLTFAKVCINTHVTRSASQALVFAIWNVFVSLRVDVLLRKSKVNYVDYMPALGRLTADEEILRFNVTINQMLGMHVLHPRYLKYT